MKIFAGNLAPEVTASQPFGLYRPFGDVKSVHVVRAMFTDAPRDFAFVEMP